MMGVGKQVLYYTNTEETTQNTNQHFAYGLRRFEVVTYPWDTINQELRIKVSRKARFFVLITGVLCGNTGTIRMGIIVLLYY